LEGEFALTQPQYSRSLILLRDPTQYPILNEKDACKALDTVLGSIYFHLGKNAIETDRRCIMIALASEEAGVSLDTELEKLDGVQLVGKGRPIEDIRTGIQGEFLGVDRKMMELTCLERISKWATRALSLRIVPYQ
jgi:hypothetical protein